MAQFGIIVFQRRNYRVEIFQLPAFNHPKNRCHRSAAQQGQRPNQSRIPPGEFVNQKKQNVNRRRSKPAKCESSPESRPAKSGLQLAELISEAWFHHATSTVFTRRANQPPSVISTK